MKRVGLLIAFFGLLFIVLPTLTAQDKDKKDPDKAEKKDDAKKDDAKKDEPKKTDDPEKKKKDEPKKEKIDYDKIGPIKVLSVNGRELTVETKEIDQKKVADREMWAAQRSQQLTQQGAQVAQQTAQANMQKDPKARFSALQNAAKANATYQNDLAKFKLDYAMKDVTSPKPWDLRAHDEGKARSLMPPVEFDDLGFEKKWTKKELEERKDKTGLPGYPVEFDQLKVGQYVEVWMVKAKKDKDQPKKKKNPDDDPPEVKTRTDFMVIVIRQQPPAPK
jgi:hypothetical protein